MARFGEYKAGEGIPAGPTRTASQIQEEKFKQGQVDTTSQTPPSAAYVTWLHTMAATRDKDDIHHRLGAAPWDAAGGNHQHLGSDNSGPLFDSTEEATGDLSTLAGLESAVKAILRAMVRRGYTDSTT
jgi:hypothetical protein